MEEMMQNLFTYCTVPNIRQARICDHCWYTCT